MDLQPVGQPFGLGRILGDFLVGRSLPAEQLQRLEVIVAGSPAVAEILSLRAVYIALEEDIVAAKIHPDEALAIDQITKAIDGLDRAIRSALPEVADVLLEVTTHHRSTLPLVDRQDARDALQASAGPEIDRQPLNGADPPW